MAKFKGILFDYGHTLVWFPQFERTHLAAAKNVQAVLLELGVSVEPSRVQSLVGSLARPKGGGVLSMEEEFNEIFASLGIKNYTPNDLTRVIWSWWSPFIRNVHARKGLNGLLEYLKEIEFKTGIVANVWGGGMDPVLERLGIRGFFEAIVASVDVGFRKPDPRIFHLALDRLKLAPEEAIMVGDNPRTDIQAAHDLGMGTVRLMRGPNRTKPDMVKPDFRISNLSMLGQIAQRTSRGPK